MKIIVIGSKGAGKGAHFSEGIVKVFKRKNHDVSFYDPLDFYTNEEKEIIHLSVFEKWYKDDYDFIFVDQCNFEFKNDIETLVFYNHKYLHRHPGVYYPDVMFHACEPFKDFFIRQEHQRYCHQIPKHEILYPAVDPDLYKPAEKTLKGIHGIGFRRSFESWGRAAGIAEGATNKLIEQEVNEFKKYAKFHDTPITDDEYKNLLSRAEATWFPIPSHQYITRRMLEAMACKTLCIMKIESETHEKVLRNMGYIRGRDYNGFDYFGYFPDLMLNLNIKERAYKTTLQNHTYKQRAEQILKIYEGLQ